MFTPPWFYNKRSARFGGEYWAEFNGTTSAINTTIIPPASGSIECEFFADVVTSTRMLVGTGNGRSFLCVQGSNIAGGVGDLSFADIRGTTVLVPETWYKAKIEWNGSTVNLSLNGSPEYSGAQVGSITTVNSWRIGAINTGSLDGSFFDGNIKNVYLRDATSAVGTYLLDGNSNDSSGNGNDGIDTDITYYQE